MSRLLWEPRWRDGTQATLMGFTLTQWMWGRGGGESETELQPSVWSSYLDDICVIS